MRWNRTTLKHEFKRTISLAFPMILSHAGIMLMGLVDTLVSGRLGTDVLAGLGLGSTFFWSANGVIIAFLLALDTFFAQAAGAGDDNGLSHYLVQGFWLSLFLMVINWLIVLAGEFLYTRYSELPGPREAYATYLSTVVWCLPMLFVFFVLQRYWQARNVVTPFAVIIILANGVNLVSNLALGLGWWGFPRLGARGIAMTTVLTRIVMILLICGYTFRKLPRQQWRMEWPSWKTQFQILEIGLPAGGQSFLEVGVFILSSFIIGFLGATAMAAHQICITMAAFSWMFSLGLSGAAAVRVGNYVGARVFAKIQMAGWLCLLLSILIMTSFAVVYFRFPEFILTWFTEDPAVIRIGRTLLMIAAAFQICDGIQVTATGALRGLGNTRSPMIANLIGHFPIGLTIGLCLCFGLDLGVTGLWIGLACGITAVATFVLGTWIQTTASLDRLKAHTRMVAPPSPP